MDENSSNSISVKRILVATDGSASSIRAANFAIHLCKLEKAELVIMHVLPDIKKEVLLVYAQNMAICKWYQLSCKLRQMKPING